MSAINDIFQISPLDGKYIYPTFQTYPTSAAQHFAPCWPVVTTPGMFVRVDVVGPEKPKKRKRIRRRNA